MRMEQEHPQAHFLVVTYPAQGHINPARHLAHRLVHSTGARVTFSTAFSAYRKMFPSATSEHEHSDGVVSYIPYSDGYDNGFDKEVHNYTQYMAQVKLVGSRTLSGILARLRDDGHPATCVVYTLLLAWAADVAREHGVPSALYWIQPATVLATYYHYFHGHDNVDKAIAAVAKDPWAIVRVSGLPALRIRDLPSFLTATSDNDILATVFRAFRDLIDTLGCEAASNDTSTKPAVLANTFQDMEPDALTSLKEHFNLIAVGPVQTAKIDDGSSNDLFKQDDKRYLEWLDAKPAKSVVYISFGSLSVMNKRQVAEIAQGMKESGKPHFWVLRKDNTKGEEANDCEESLAENAMVVEWCDQVRVLSHPAVGCFVTHCGWNSTLESITCGVPVIGVPQWTDQGTNAWLVEQQLGTGVRATVSEKDGVMESDELQRCLEFVMTEKVRAKAAMWKEKARAAVTDGGSSERNLRAFVGEFAGCN